MLRTRFVLIIVLSVLWIGIAQVASAQENTVPIPDLTGLSVPEAAARLNRSGLNLGSEKPLPWAEGTTTPQNTINSQSIPAGQKATRGTAVDVTVMRPTNILLIYDYNSLTIVNRTGGIFDLSDVTLNTFAARSWPKRLLDNNQCAQISATRLNKAQPVADCAGIQTWFWTGNDRDHFWRSTPDNLTFSFSKSGKQYASCAAVTEGSGATHCAIYIAGLGQSETMEYIYMAYTSDQLIIRNRSKDLWLPLAGVTFINNLPSAAGTKINIADAALYPTRSSVGSVDKLAPGQCLWFTTGSQITTPPEPCDSMGRLELKPEQAFWSADFGVDGVSDSQTHTCPQATPGKLTICAMPR